MNRFRRNGANPKHKDSGEKDETQALIDEEDEEIHIDVPTIYRGTVSRRNRLGNGYELKSIQRPRDTSLDLITDFTYYDIRPGDSLQSVCLRYACPLNQVKRLNGLMTDQDFYGLRRLKLPLGKLGLLEDFIKQDNPGCQEDLMQMHNNNDFHKSEKQYFTSNSPGSALSITSPRYKPLLSPGHSSDNLNSKVKSHDRVDLHPSHSFSSLRDLHNISERTNINSSSSSYGQNYASRIDTDKLRQETLIKTNLNDEAAKITIDSLMTDDPKLPNVFEVLDYHVEQVKVSAETYDQRAEELANRININGSDGVTQQTTRASKIPELFFSGENFGLNLTKLVVLIFFICLVVPFVYMNQVNVIKKQL